MYHSYGAAGHIITSFPVLETLEVIWISLTLPTESWLIIQLYHQTTKQTLIMQVTHHQTFKKAE